MNLAASTLATSGSPPPFLRHRIRVRLSRCAAARCCRGRLRAFGAPDAARWRRRREPRQVERGAVVSARHRLLCGGELAVAVLVLLQLPEGGQLEANVEEGQILRAAEDRERAREHQREERGVAAVLDVGQPDVALEAHAVDGDLDRPNHRLHRWVNAEVAAIDLSAYRDHQQQRERRARSRMGQRDDGVGRHERGDRDRQRQRLEGRPPHAAVLDNLLGSLPSEAAARDGEEIRLDATTAKVERSARRIGSFDHSRFSTVTL